MARTRNSELGFSLTRRLLLGAALATLAGAPAEAADASADAFIERVGEETIKILKERSVPAEQRAARLKELLNRSTDLPYVGRVILGRYWPRATPEQQQQYLGLFDKLVMQAMAERIDSYAGQSFKITGSRRVDDRDTLVSTQIAQPAGGPAYRVDWRVRKAEGGGFQLIDIVAEGVSLVVTQRSEAGDIVSRNGIDGLLAEMQRRLDQRNVTGNLPGG